MKPILLSVAIVLFISVSNLTQGAAKLFFFKAYNEDFKKSSTSNFLGGDPIFGLVNVSLIAISDNTATTVEEFADQNGNVMITVYFSTLDKSVSWTLPLASGLVKKNRFLFPILPDKFTAAETHYGEILKILKMNAGKALSITVQVGKPDVTTTWTGDFTIDLTRGMGAYDDWYTQNVPASIRNTNTYYDICYNRNHGFNYDEISVNTLTADTIKFVGDGRYNIVARKIENFDLYKAREFYVSKVGDQSILLYSPEMGDFCYYSLDKSLKRETDKSKACSYDALEKMKADVKRYQPIEKAEYEKQKVEAEKKDAIKDAETAKLNKAKLTTYLSTFRSRRTDPGLEKKIIEWWNNHNPDFPAIKVYFLGADYYLTRNEYDQVLRKSLGALVLYKGKQGSCWTEWNSFGYEHLGGGAFNDELGAWMAGYKAHGYYEYNAGGVTMVAGNDYEVDCKGFK